MTKRSGLVLFLVIFPIAVAAQEAAQEPDIAILATVRGKTLRFEHVPEVRVVFTGDARNQTVWKSDRTNLPDKVQPHVTYRDIGIRLTITSTLPNIEQILDEALGGNNGSNADLSRSAAGQRDARRAAATGTDDHER